MKIIIKILTINLLFLVTYTYAFESSRLSDVIKSTGNTGPKPIDLHLDTNLGSTIQERMTRLEQLRLDNIDAEGNGFIVFGVDINEAANGTEKASTQGVAIEFVELLVTRNGQVQSYTDYVTETQALVASDADTTRQLLYTLLGETGSNRITGSDILDKFDSTLSIRVPESLSDASEVTLEIRLVTTNVALGDPEAFYDFSNGFEDLAVLTKSDKDYLDDLQPGRDEAPMVIEVNPSPDSSESLSWQSFPSSTSYYIVGYEDLYPLTGDYDFNDLTVAYQVQFGFDTNNALTTITGKAYLIARGANYTHDWHLHISMPGNVSGTVTSSLYTYDPNSSGLGQVVYANQQRDFSGPVDMKAFEDTVQILPSGPEANCQYANAEMGCSFIPGPKFEFHIALDMPVSIDQMAEPPFDPYLFVRRFLAPGDPNYEIHLKDKPLAPNRIAQGYAASDNVRDGLTTFVDGLDFPFAMIIVDEWFPPYEAIDLNNAYPDFPDFVASGGVSKADWYVAPAIDKVREIRRPGWEW